MGVDDKLTDKQKLFVYEYLIDLNSSQAAIRAGYSPASSRNQGCELMKNPNVQKAIQERMDKRSEAIGLSAEKVLKRMDSIADLDIADAFDENGRLLPVPKMPVHVRKAISSIKVYEDSIEGTKMGEVKEVKFWNKDKNNELIGRHLKLFTEKHEVEHTMAVDKLSDSDLDDKIAQKIALLSKK